MNEAEKERLIKKDIESVENRVRHAFNQGYEMGLKEAIRMSSEDDGRVDECYSCGFNDEDYGCTCPHSDKWYACPIEAKKENRRLRCNIMTISKNTAR